jgi:hypothetical protein
MARRGRPPKSEAAQEQTQVQKPEQVTVIDLDAVRLMAVRLYSETQKPRYDCDHNGHDLARMVGYLERGLEDLIDALDRVKE